MELFFATYAILGLKYEGSENSSAYRIYLGLVVFLAVVTSLQSLFSRGLALRHFILLLIPVGISVLFMLDNALGRTEPQSSFTYVLWAALSAPAFLVGIAVSKTQQLRRASLVFEPVMLVLSVAAIVYAIGNFAGGLQVSGMGGATYQTASYISALAFGLNLYHLFFGVNHHRWAYARTPAYSVVSIILLPVQAAAGLLSGGRGGVVLIAAYTVVLVILAGVYRAKSRLGQGMSALVILGAVGYLSVPSILNSDFAPRIIGRVFAYLGPYGLNWSGTSGRDSLYIEAWEAILDAPLLGYGLFSWGIGDYPHNLFLELLLNGGFLYLVCGLAALLTIIVKIKRRSQIEPEVLVLVAVGLFPFVMLQFSGSYWTTTSFWFVAGAALSWDRINTRPQNHSTEEKNQVA